MRKLWKSSGAEEAIYAKGKVVTYKKRWKIDFEWKFKFDRNSR